MAGESAAKSAALEREDGLLAEGPATAAASTGTAASASASATTNLEIECIGPWDTHVRAKHIVVESPFVTRVVQIGDAWIPYLVSRGVHIGYIASSRFMGPVLIRVLSEKVIILVFIHDQRDFRRMIGAFCLKSCHLDIGIISQYPGDHTGTCFRSRAREAFKSRGTSWLVERGITMFHSFAATDLFRIIHIEGVREAVVCLADRCISIPAVRFIEGFPSCEGGLAGAFSLVYFAEGLARKGTFIATGAALTLAPSACLLYFPRSLALKLPRQLQ